MRTNPAELDELKALTKNTLLDGLGIEFTRITEDEIEATMPVDSRTRQIYGILHGGASAALAETLGSVGGLLCVDRSKFRVVGLELNANHVRPVAEGKVTGIARPLHLGKTTQVWDIRIHNDKQELTCISRLTLAVVPIPSS